MHAEAEAVIKRLGMVPIPVEGGWYRQTWRSATVLPGGSLPGYRTDKPAGSAILALFCEDPEGFSALHRLPTTEVWHFCGGDPFALLLLHPDRSSQEIVLGPDVTADHEVQVVVTAGTWMGGEVVSGGRFALLGCTMAPGFTDEDFESARGDDLTGAYPERASRIRRLTRPAATGL